MRTALLLALLAALAAVAALLATRPATPPTPDRLLPKFPPEKAAGIEILSSESRATLQLANGTWTVAERGGYPADGPRILRLLRTVWELRPVQSFPVSENDLPRLELAAPPAAGNASASPAAGDASASAPAATGTLLRFLDEAGNELGAIILGKRHMRDGQGGFPGMAVGRYVRNAADPSQVALVSETFDDAAPAPQTWLDKEFLKIENPVAVGHTPAGNATQAWEITKKDGAWHLEGAKKSETLDASKAALAASALSGLTFSDLGPETFEPGGTVGVTTAEGIRYTIEIGPRESGEVPVRISAEILPDAKEGASLDAIQRFLDRTFLVPGYTLDQLAVERQRLLVEPPPTPTPTPTPSPAPARAKKSRGS